MTCYFTQIVVIFDSDIMTRQARQNRWSLYSHMVSVRTYVRKTKTRLLVPGKQNTR